MYECILGFPCQGSSAIRKVYVFLEMGFFLFWGDFIKCSDEQTSSRVF